MKNIVSELIHPTAAAPSENTSCQVTKNAPNDFTKPVVITWTMKAAKVTTHPLTPPSQWSREQYDVAFSSELDELWVVLPDSESGLGRVDMVMDSLVILSIWSAKTETFMGKRRKDDWNLYPNVDKQNNY